MKFTKLIQRFTTVAALVLLLTGCQAASAAPATLIENGQQLSFAAILSQEREELVLPENAIIMGYARNRLVYLVGTTNGYDIYLYDCKTRQEHQIARTDAVLNSGHSATVGETVYFDLGYVDHQLQTGASRIYAVDTSTQKFRLAFDTQNQVALSYLEKLDDDRIVLFPNTQYHTSDNRIQSSLKIYQLQSGDVCEFQKGEFFNSTLTGDWVEFASACGDSVYALLQQSVNSVARYRITRYDREGNLVATMPLDGVENYFRTQDPESVYKGIIDFVAISHNTFLISDLDLESMIIRIDDSKTVHKLYEGPRLFPVWQMGDALLLYGGNGEDSTANYLFRQGALTTLQNNSTDWVLGFWRDEAGNVVIQTRNSIQNTEPDRYYLLSKL